MAKPKGAFTRLNDHFHSHPRGRFHEILFWMGLGLAVMGFALAGWRFDWLSEPFVWLTGVVGACLFGWAFLPQRKPKHVAPPPPGRLRAQKTHAVRASKQEGRDARAAKRGGR